MSTSGQDRRQTSLEEAIAVIPVDGRNFDSQHPVGLVRGIIIPLYSLNRSHINKPSGAFGGYAAALLCQCAHTYLLLTRPSPKPTQPDPINSPFQLFSPNSPGPVRLSATLL